MYDVVNMPDLVVRYFSSTPWLIIFLASTLYLFLRMNTAMKRAVLAALVAFFLLINSLVIKLFTELNQNSTFYRNLWAIPLIILIGIAAIDFIRVIPRWYLKLPIIGLFAVVLWFVNGQEYIRCRAQIFSADGILVQEDVIDLGNMLDNLRKKESKNTLFVMCPTGYERPYGNLLKELNLYSGIVNISGSSVLNDFEHNGEQELMSGNPDVDYIMSKCCSNGIDYVIVKRLEGNEEAFRQKGYAPVLVTAEYMLFHCEGYYGYQQDMDQWWQTSWKSWYDNDGRAVLNEGGYSRIEYEYDREGRLISEQYLDTSGDLINNVFAYARCEYTYEKEMLTETRFFDSEGKPCVRYDDMCGVIRYTWNNLGQLIMIRYYNEKEELINYDFRNPRAITRFEYDDQGNQTAERYFDIKDKPSQALSGYDEIRREYDEDNRLVRMGYYANGKLIDRSDTGYAEVIYEYNENGEQNTIYINKDGQIIEP